MKSSLKKAFTLMEFMVTVVLVSIIGSIAYFAYIGYMESARDSVRATDIATISRALDGYFLSYSEFPEPGTPVNVTYSGANVWTQGTFGKITDYTMGEISNLPVDPATGDLYAYSITKSKKEYQIASVYETFVVKNSLVEKVNAKSLVSAEAYVRGNYNGVIAKASAGENTYVLALPTILSSNLDYDSIEETIENQAFVYHGFENLTDNYKDGPYDLNGGFIFNPDVFIVYETNDLTQLSKEDEQLIFLKNIQDAYKGSSVEKKSEMIENILNTDIESNKAIAIKLARNFIFNFIDRNID